MKPLENSSDHHPGGDDDLRNIKGIGVSIAQILNDFGISSYTDLISYTPEELLEKLKGRLPGIALQRARPEEWIRQAHTLLNDQKLPMQSTSGSQAVKAGRDWREIADFFVSFGYEIQSDGRERLMTRVHHSQDDQPMEWDGLETEELVTWMLGRAKLMSPAEAWLADLPQVAAGEAVAAPSTEYPAEPEAVHLELSNLWVEEISVPVGVDTQPQTDLLRLKGNLQISGPDGESCTYERLEYNLELFLVDSETKQSKLVRTYANRLEPGRLEYLLQEDFPIPPVGRYHLFVAARLLSSSADAVHLQGPIIEVEP